MNRKPNRVGYGLVAVCLLFLTGCVSGGGAPEVEDPSSARPSGEERRLAKTVEEMVAFEAVCAKHAEETDALDLLAIKVTDHLAQDSTLPLGEWGLGTVSIDDDGNVGEMAITRASSPAFGSALKASFMATGPHAAFEGMDQICFAGQSLLLRMEGPRELRCQQQEDVYTYVDEVGLAVYKQLYRPHLMKQPGNGYVRFSLAVGLQGGVEDMKILSSPSDAVTQKLKRAVQAAAPYPTPPRFESCFENQPFKLRLEVVDSESD